MDIHQFSSSDTLLGLGGAPSPPPPPPLQKKIQKFIFIVNWCEKALWEPDLLKRKADTDLHESCI
jgi:hypothetical protein